MDLQVSPMGRLMKHILESVLDVDIGSKLYLAMQYNAIESPYTVYQMNYQELIELQFPLDQNFLGYLPFGHVGRIIALKAYVEYHASVGIEMKEEDMMHITKSSYNTFRMTKYLEIRESLKLPDYKYGTTPRTKQEPTMEPQVPTNQVPATATNVTRTFILAPNNTLKPPKYNPKLPKLQKLTHLAMHTQALTQPDEPLSNPPTKWHQPAPNIKSNESPKSKFDGENWNAHHNVLPQHSLCGLSAAIFGERKSIFILMNGPRQSNCLGNSARSPWGEMKAYMAHIGWENGENNVNSFLDDRYKLPP